MSTMKALTKLPVDDDILDILFTFLSDFNSLRACILTSHSFLDVFNRHPKSIVRHIAENICGPPINEALTLVRFKKTLDPDDERTVSYFLQLPTWLDASEADPITPEEAQELERYATIAHELENFFSFRHKDRTSMKSELTPKESTRFLRAVYQLLLFERCFNFRDDESEAEYEWAELASENPQELESTVKCRKDFLDSFSVDELRAIEVVTEFFSERCVKVGGLSECSAILALGPGYILQHMKEGDTYFDDSTDEFVEPFVDGYLSTPMRMALEARKLQPLDPGDDKFWKHVLDETCGQHDQCDHCGAVKGFDLWNKSNWAQFFTFSGLTKNHLPMEFPGNLRYHATESQLLNKCRSVESTKLLQEIFDVKVGSEYESWSEEDWTCDECLKQMIRALLPAWYIERKRADGESHPTDDCWYGWNCRTQTHSSHHASRLNHFCKPTRGN